MDHRKIAIISTIGIVLLGAAGIGIAAWRLRQAPVESPAAPTEHLGSVTETGAPPPGVAPSGGNGQAVTQVMPPKTPYVCDVSVTDADCDLDGLTNGREAIAKTDARKADTDGDGVSDGGEVDAWKSDPLDPTSIDPSMSDYDAIAAGKRDTRARAPEQP